MISSEVPTTIPLKISEIVTMTENGGGTVLLQILYRPPGTSRGNAALADSSAPGQVALVDDMVRLVARHIGPSARFHHDGED
jgi:hypothetical protein